LNLFGKLPVGKTFARSIAANYRWLKGMVSSSSNLFEALKLATCPIDGHNVAKLKHYKI
jgi:hypothetical protein